MLTLQEALLFKAVKEEEENQQALALAGLGGGAAGALVGRGIGGVTHQVGRGINALKPNHKRNILKPGFRMAGGLTGAILGGALGAGTAALMKQDDAGKLLGKIQAQGGKVDAEDEMRLSRLLGELYSNPGDIG